MVKTMVFIDSRVNDLDLLVSQFEAGTEYNVLDASYDGLLQMEEFLADKDDYSSIQIISHGSAGAITIGSTLLNSNNLLQYQSQLENIGYTLTDNGDLLLYGCNVGTGEAGKLFVAKLAAATRADVAASDNVTGSAASGGDWILENSTGTIDALQVLSDNSAENYSYSLGQATVYSSARGHLNQLIQIDFSKIPADDLSSIVPLQLSVLSNSNYFDKEINSYDLLFAIERMAQIGDELFLATTDTKALFNYMSIADNAYYISMLSTELSFHSSFDSIMQNAKPALLDYVATNFAQIRESISVVSKAIFDAVETGAGRIGDVLFSSGQSLTNILPSTYSYLAGDIGLDLLQTEKFTQFMYAAVKNTNGLFEDFAALFSARNLVTKEQILVDSSVHVAAILDAYLPVEESISGFTGSKELQSIVKFIDAIRSVDVLINDIEAISTAAEATSLTGLSDNFLDDAQWIKSLEGFDIAKDVIGLLIPLLNQPSLNGLVSCWAKAAVTISDLVALSGKTEWNMLADQFSTYGQLLPIVTNYQSSISFWLKHADSLSGGTWGLNLAADQPSLPLSLILGDAPGTTATPYRIAVGETFHGNMNSADNDSTDDDWIAVSLVAGQDYRFQLTNGTFDSADIKLYDALGKLLANPDYSLCSSTTSVIQGTALVSGTCYIAVDSNSSGSYTVSFNTAAPLASLTELGDAPGTIGTPYRISLGETFRGNLNSADNDSANGDWIAVSFVAGQDYRLQLNQGSSSYASIKLYDEHGTLVANPDASLGSVTSPVIQGTALVSGTCFIAVDRGSGSYIVSFNTATPLATITELEDAPGTTETPYRIAVGETFRGNLNSADTDFTKSDWIAVSLEAGQDYRLQLTLGTLYSAEIKLYDAQGNLIANPTGSTSSTSFIRMTAAASGTYYVSAHSYSYFGSYKISVVNTVTGTYDNDFFVARGTAEQINGAAGEDTVSYSNSESGVAIDLSKNHCSGGYAEGDSLFSIENLIGSSSNDTFIGDGNSNVFQGQGGNDTLDGGEGDDTAVFRGNFADYLIGYNALTLTRTVVDRIVDRDGTDFITGVEIFKFADATKLATDFVLDPEPTIVMFSPVDASSGVTVGSDIVMTFSEVIQKGTGTIVIHSGSATGAIEESYDVTTSSNLEISGSRLTINPTADLASGTHYFVTLGEGTLKDLTGKNYTGTDTYDFTTAAAFSAHALTGSVTFWKTGAALADVTSTFSSVPAAFGTQPVEFRNIHVAADGTRSIEIWETSMKSDIKSVHLGLSLPTGSAATWQEAAAFTTGWSLIGNTDKPGEFTLDGNGTTALSSGTVKLGTLTLTVPTNPQHVELSLNAAQLGNDTVPSVGLSSDCMTTGTDGLYQQHNMTLGTYTLTSEKASGAAEANAANRAVDLLDAIAILKSIVGLTTLDANQKIAADFDNANGVDLNDAIGILKHVVGLSAPTPEWLFVDKVAPAYNHLADPMTIDVTADTSVDLVGILRGDVDGSWAV